MIGIESLLRLVAPFDCLMCRHEGRLLCEPCQKMLRRLPSRCYRCLVVSKDGAVCESCRPLTVLSQVWVATEYDEVARELVKALKFDRARDGAHLMAGFVAASLPALPRDMVVTHVPTANRRVRERGYDQAALIARRVAKLRELPYRPLLRRHGHSRQVGANRTQRQTQLRAAFSFTGTDTPRQVLLVDDVLTTGATIEATAAVLKQAGVRHINAASFAQKPPSNSR